MIHVPLLRAGRPYRSLETATLTDVRDGSVVAQVSQAIPGMIARDLLAVERDRDELQAIPIAELLAITKRAGELFATAELPLGDGTQTPEQYLEQLAATTGMPIAMGRANLGKIVHVLTEMPAMLDGLTRGLDLAVLDGGWGVQGGRRLSYAPLASSLGAVLPNNSPGVHALWLPAFALKVPLVLKPGSAEPWTPLRVAQAFLAAGAPPCAFRLYPSKHAGATEILLRTDRSLFFGDAKTVEAWRGSGKVQVHGPGWSKVILGEDAAVRFRDHLDVLVESVAANGGRSCINASAVWTPSHGREIAAALAERLAAIEPRPLDDPEARLAAFADPRIAERIDAMIERELGFGGAEDASARWRSGPRRVVVDGCAFLRPTVISTADPDHPLARAEFTFPFVTVVEVAPERLLETIGPTLVGTLISDDEVLRRRALACRSIDRLNLGPVPTPRISWDQPHEGNLFDHLYQQRAFQLASAG